MLLYEIPRNEQANQSLMGIFNGGNLDTQVRKNFGTSTQEVRRFVLEGLSGIQNFESLSKVFFRFIDT